MLRGLFGASHYSTIMKKFIVAALTVVVAVSLTASDFPKGSPKFESSFRAVTSAAKKSGKPMVVVFSASWCPPCQAMKKEVYPSKEVAEFHDKFEWAYLDVDQSDNEKASKDFGVNGIPHVVFLDKDGKEVDKQVGGVSPAEFATMLRSTLAKAGPKS
jgi:thioredoxin-related protein